MNPSDTRRILIIDDQESIHQDYRKIMMPPAAENSAMARAEAELFGNVVAQREPREWDLYEIDSAFQGAEAVRMVQQALAQGRPYAVAFVDIRMPPGCDGIQTIRQLWAIDPELLVVICSAYSDYCWEDIVHELGRTDRFLILRKPFENIEVRQCAAALSERWVIARTDALTGLLNRRAFQEQLHREWTCSVRHQQPLCCLMLDIDYFKTLNDRFGHSVGDQVLRTVSAEILSAKRPGDTVCRYGGEEFCVLMPATHEEDGQRWAESLRQSLAQHPLVADDTGFQITASFGLSAAHEATLGEQQLLEQADAALRQSKRAGRDRVTRWSDYGSASPDARRMRQYAAIFENVEAHQMMTNHVACVREDMSVGQAAETLVRCGLNGVPVVDQHGQLTGMVSEKDLMEALGSESSWSTPVCRLMSSSVIHYSPQTSAQIIFDFLCRVQLRHVVIVEDGRPVGTISRGSFLRFIGNYLKSTGSAYATIDSHAHLLTALESLMSRTTQLRSDVEARPEALIPYVVSGVSSIEMLLSDMLTWANCQTQNKDGEKLAGCI